MREGASLVGLAVRGVGWLNRHLAAVCVLVSAALFVPGLAFGASWWNALPDALVVIPVVLSFLVGWRVGFPATVVALVALAFGTSAGDLSASVVSMWVLTVPAWAIGLVMRSRSNLSAQLAQRAVDLERQREEFARESVRYERARIARDLHDIVAHNLSLIVVQAGAGRRAPPERPEMLAESLRHIEVGAVSARKEIDQLVGLLGDNARGESAVADFGRLDELLRRAAASGLSITYSSIGSREQVSPALAQVAYRVTQEGIANALKHAPGSPIRVEVDVGELQLSVTVENSAPTAGGDQLGTVGGGFGIAGLRERIVELRGTLDAQPTSAGGWWLSARVPLLRPTQDTLVD